MLIMVIKEIQNLYKVTSFLDITIIIAFLLISLITGLLASKHIKTLQDYFYWNTYNCPCVQ